MEINIKTIEEIERRLTACSDLIAVGGIKSPRELNRGYCQGAAFVLEQLGYRVAWDNGKAYVVKDD